MADHQASFKKFKLKALLDENPDSDQYVVKITTDASGNVTAVNIQPIENVDGRAAAGTIKNGCPFPPGC